MNLVILSGRLVRDPEIVFNDDKTRAAFTIAVNKSTKSRESNADFINCTAWGKLAENISKYTSKGCRVMAYGRIVGGTFQNSNGESKYFMNVNVLSIEFIDYITKEHEKESSDAFLGEGFVPLDDNNLPF